MRAERITGLLLMGRASYRLGQYAAALEYIQAAMELTAYTEDKDGEARCNLILGWIYQRLGNYEAVAEYFRRKLEIRQAIGDRYGEANALSHLGWVCYDQENYARGEGYCLQAIDISRQIGDRENEAYALTSLQGCSVLRTEQVQCTFAPPYKAKLTYFTQQIAREDNALSALHLSLGLCFLELNSTYRCTALIKGAAMELPITSTQSPGFTSVE